MNYYRIPSKFVQDNLIFSTHMGEFFLKDFRVDRESFPNELFLYVKSGTFYIEQYGKKITLKSGDCALLSLRDKHLYYSDENDVADFFWMHFSGNMLIPIMSKLSENEYLPIVLNDKNIAKDLCECYNITTQNDNFEYILSAKIYEIFMKFTGDYLAEIDLKSSDHNPKFIKMSLNHIENHIYDKISLDELANRVHMDKFYFIQQFTKYLNVTPIKYITQRKIEVATKLLETSGVSINEISQNLGFFDQSHFNKVFKEKIGINPSAYRKMKSKIR